MNFISHYSSYSYYFQHNFVVLCLLEHQELTLLAGLAREQGKRERERERETDWRMERGTSRDLQRGDCTERETVAETVATVRDPF